MDKCMKDDSKLMLEEAMQHKLTNLDAELCAETWNTLFPLSGAICVISGICFWLTSGVEEIDSVIDPIAIEVARKRGWKWGKEIEAEAAAANGHAEQPAEPGKAPPAATL